MNERPRSILLATDLSPRCDRALDRAVSLSQQWQAKLTVLHVLEDPRDAESDPVAPSWRRPPDPGRVAERQLLTDVGPAAETADVLIAEGNPAEAIIRTAEKRGCDLIVTGIARDELLGRFILGTTVDQLLRRSRVPVLVVRRRARQPYAHIAVATDFSKSSRHALEVATRYFPEEVLTIFHAYAAPMSALTSDTAAHRRQYREIAEQDYETFLKSMKSGQEIKRRARSFIEYGAPAEILREGVREMNIDLVVLGTQGRSALSEVLIGSVAKHIMAELPCDILMVREALAVRKTAA